MDEGKNYSMLHGISGRMAITSLCAPLSRGYYRFFMRVASNI